MSSFDENSNFIQPLPVHEGECSSSSPRNYHELQTPNVGSAATSSFHHVQAEVSGSQQLDAPNNQSGQREAASSREQVDTVDPGQAAFPIRASGGALVSDVEVPATERRRVFTSLSPLLVNPMTDGGVSAEMAANLGLSVPLLRESSHSASSVINEVLAGPLPNPSEFPILDDNPMFDDSFDWGSAQPLDIGNTILKMCRRNNVSLHDIPRKFRELCEREQYWVTGPNGQGGISEAFAKRLFDFMKYEEGKFPFIFLTLQFSSGGEMC